MTNTNIPFLLNRKPGVLTVDYESNQSAAKSGFDLFVGHGFDVEMCIGYPTMHAYIKSYTGTGYATACTWIQIVTRLEFDSLDAVEPINVEPSVDNHPTLAELGIPFFAFGFLPEIFDAPRNNLNGLARLEWIADTFMVTLPSRVNDNTISRIASFRWGYTEFDRDEKRQVQINPLVVTEQAVWNQHLPLLTIQFGKWSYQ